MTRCRPSTQCARARKISRRNWAISSTRSPESPEDSFRDNQPAATYPHPVTDRRMKLPPSFLASLILTFAALGAGNAFAELPAAPIRESEQRQAQLQGETKLLADTLNAMLGEYERNNLAGDDVATVRRLRES